MEMGMTILYKIDDSCISKHLNDRKPKQDIDDLESVSSMSRLSIVHNQSIHEVIYYLCIELRRNRINYQY